MATDRPLRRFILGSGFFLVAILAVLLLIAHDLLGFLVLPVLIAVLLLLEAKEKLTKS